MSLWQRLPIIKIPLRPGDADVPLDLQALVDQCYRNGGYEGTLDYAVDPDPPLLGAEKDSAEEHLFKIGIAVPQKAAATQGQAEESLTVKRQAFLLAARFRID